MLKLIGDLKECIENYMPCSIVTAGTVSGLLFFTNTCRSRTIRNYTYVVRKSTCRVIEYPNSRKICLVAFGHTEIRTG